MTRPEEGSVSVLMLYFMMVVMAFSMAMLYYVRSGTQANDTYELEMRLRLAAESAVEQEAVYLEQHPEQIAAWQGKEKVKLDDADIAPAEGIKICLTALLRQEKLYLVAYVENEKQTTKWIQHKMVKGVLKKAGERFVWQGWAP